MRILFSFAGGRGHVEPLLPVAGAAQAAGHTVAFAGSHTTLRVVEALGFDVFPFGPAPADTPPRRIPLQKLDAEREQRDLRERFIRRLARQRVPAVLDLCAAWQPDVLVCDETDFGAALGAERLGLPQATMLVTASGAFVVPAVVDEPLGELRAEHGLPPDQELAMRSRYLVLSPFPPSFREPDHPLPATAHSFRPGPVEAARPDDIPPWLARLGDAPLVYVTLGTVFNLESGDLFMRVLAGLRELPVHVVVTVGSQIDPDELGSLPENIHVARFIPQSTVLPFCSAVVSHGGSGSVIGALAHGLPQVVIPMGADQPLNAKRCDELGVAQVLDPMTADGTAVRDAVSAVLSDPGYRIAAERIRDEIAGLPGPASAVTLLERLADERRSSGRMAES